MIARSTQSALIALLALILLGLAAPQPAQAHEHEHDHESHGHGYRSAGHYDDDDGPRYSPPRNHGWRHHHDYYAPRAYPDVVIYQQEAPRAYYYSPMEPVYPREYGTVGIHLDYNWLY